MSRLDDLVVTNPMPGWRIMAWPVMVLLVVAIVWAIFAQLDEVAVAQGEVVPIGDIKVIQHLEGGIIQTLNVQEGTIVRQGDPLLQLDLGSTGTNERELQVRLDSQYLVKARLEAEAQGQTQVRFPQGVTERLPSQAAAERQAFQTRMQQLATSVSVQQEQVRQRELEVQELEAQVRATQSNLTLASERFRMSESLLSEGLTARMEHLQLEAEVESLQGELSGLQASIPRARAAVNEALERVRETETRFRREAQDELGGVEQNIARITELLQEASEQGARALIRSPIDGIVQNLRYKTIGGVVRPGEPIMDIVPTGDRLVIEAKLNPVDRGYVNTGMETVVQISTYDFARYGGLDGRVILVAPDSSTDENGVPFFRVVVETDKTYLGFNEGDLPIMPGMQATVDIHTGTKSVMDYLVKPVLKLRHEAFRER
ncbi:MAG: HlyD family type I secretion periplasmic adaptor subunit [Magnetovibrionaceae bacterium]